MSFLYMKEKYRMEIYLKSAVLQYCCRKQITLINDYLFAKLLKPEPE